MNRSRNSRAGSLRSFTSTPGPVILGVITLIPQIQEAEMSINPYESSPSHATTPKMQPNKLGAIGFTCSACGVAGVIGGMLLTAQFGVSAAFQLLIAISLLLCPVGLVLSLIGAFSTPRRLAIWGVLTGLFGSLHINTFWVTFQHSR